MPLGGVLAISGLFLGTELHTGLLAGEPRRENQPTRANGEEWEQAKQQNATDQLRQAGVDSKTIQQLSENGFQQNEVEAVLVEAFQHQGLGREQARQRARETAQRLTAETGQRSGAQAQIRELAPEGAEIRDSAEMVVNEERLNVQKRQVPIGGILLRKKVTQDTASETVELRREDIEIIRLSPEEARQRQDQEQYQSAFEEAFQEGEVFIPLMREEALAEKQVQVREIVRAKPEVKVEEKQFEATLRKEQVEVERLEQEGQAQAVPGGDSASRLVDQMRTHLRESELNLTQQQLGQMEIEVEERKVRLSGTVPNEQVKQEIQSVIEKFVEDLPQIEKVENELEIM
jgi:stress response protein YsnF